MTAKYLSIEQSVFSFILENRLVSRGDCLLLAVSGGADSVCLLNVMLSLKEELGIKLHAAHLDHQLRAEESQADAAYVYELAQSLDIPVTVSKADVRGYQKKHRLSLEEAAREVRYDFLVETAAAIGTDIIATGHTLDDQVETIMLHIIRGSGIAGLVGLNAKSKRLLNGHQVDIIRPLLEISREETQQYCLEHNLAARLDSTNQSMSILRNRIRLKLLPELKKYNPGFVESLLRTAAIAADEIAFLDGELEKVWKSVVIGQDEAVILDKEQFDAMPNALKHHLLRVVIKNLLGTLKDIEERHIEEIMGVLGKQAGKYINLPYGLVFAVEYGRYLLGRDTKALCPFPGITAQSVIKVPGITAISGWSIEASVTDNNLPVDGDNQFTAYLDADKCGVNLAVRRRIEGDRFQPLGFDTPKRLNRFMIDLKIPQAWRERVPLVCCHGQGLPVHGQIIWVAGYRIDDRYKVTADTERVLKIEFKRV
ncbi:MAG: tRNA lysidine(34) synthetase TilS [Dehalococcoidales bacterium]|nr:tRNA lysidine(34) synthetase TilS [Dehalococcoidales bacterium]